MLRRTIAKPPLLSSPCRLLPSSFSHLVALPHPYILSTRQFATNMSDFLCIDAFCLRQFEKSEDPASGFIDCDKTEFLTKVNEYVAQKQASGEAFLVDGYAPFCKHIFIPNFTSTTPTYVAITDDNKSLIETSYAARTEKELPVLNRFISGSKLTLEPAKYLDLILYSREQLDIENAAMGNSCTDTAPWGIVSVKAQDHGYETPMQPITMMRNALGVEQGGSGVPLDREQYNASVDFWSKHVSVM